VVHYMMGGIHTDIKRRHPSAGAVRRGRVRLREHQWREPARARTRSPSCWCSGRARR
jgi:hypothetical protein